MRRQARKHHKLHIRCNTNNVRLKKQITMDIFARRIGCHEPLSPIYLHELVDKVRGDYLKNHGNIPPKLQELCDIVRKITPRPRQPKHGKKCRRCLFKMHCKSIRCPNCHCPQRKRKKQTPCNNNN